MKIMRKYFRTAGTILLIFLMTLEILCGIAVSEMSASDPNRETTEAVLERLRTEYLQEGMDEFAQRMERFEIPREEAELVDALAEQIGLMDEKNIVYTVCDEDGAILYESCTCEDTEAAQARFVECSISGASYTAFSTLRPAAAEEEFRRKNSGKYDFISAEWDSAKGRTVIRYKNTQTKTRTLILEVRLDRSLPVGDAFRAEYRFLREKLPYRDYYEGTLVILPLIMLALSTLLFVDIKEAKGDRRLARCIDRLPLEIPILVSGALLALLLPQCDFSQAQPIYREPRAYVIPIVCALAAFAVVLVLLPSLVRRIRGGKWWKNTLACRYGRTVLRNFGCCLSALWRNLPLYWKAGLFWTVLSAAEFFAMRDSISWFWVAEKLAFTPLLIVIVVELQRLRNGANQLRSGKLNAKISTAWMPPLLREHAECLNHLGDGMSAAVDEQVRSRRTKDELITNITHDIKTPLTSIINYVDLLKKDGLDSPKAGEYLTVLERQSARLKKLMEDLVEASKAAAGSIPVESEPLDLNVMLSQTLGEYAARLEEQGLSAVIPESSPSVPVTADGRLLWRIFDNLLSNICKYSLPNTRVYLRTGIAGDQGFAEFKNISAQPLNVAPNELLERFVRGDASRNTEGSGLGLTIAQSLTELQGGRLLLQIDGDLFKVTVFFPLAEDPA